MIITPETENDMFKLFLENLSSIRMVFDIQFLVPMANCFYLFCRYVNQSTMVDHIFPPLSCLPDKLAALNALPYSAFTYWREPLKEVNPDDATRAIDK